MTRLKTILTSLILSALLACKNGSDKKVIVNYKDGKQVPIIDTTLKNIGIAAQDSAEVGVQYCAKIWLTTDSLKLIKSYALCDFTSSLVDTVAQTLDNCASNQLKIIQDTTYFCLKPKDTIRVFDYKLGIMTIDKRDHYHLNILHLKFKSFKKTAANMGLAKCEAFMNSTNK